MKNQHYEQALTAEGVQWTYTEKMMLDAIDLRKGLQNQARLTCPLDQELVVQYATAKKNGAELPPVVLYKSGKKYVPIDGNQRLAADVQLKRKHTDAYIVHSTDPMILDRLTWNFNNLVNGKRLSPEENLEHAVSYVRKYGVTVEVACKEWSLPVWKVKDALTLEKAKEVLNRQNVKSSPSLTNDKIKELIYLNNVGEDLFAKAAQVVAETGALQEDIRELVKTVKAASTHEEKMQVIDAFASSEKILTRKAETKGGTLLSTKSLPRARFIHAIRSLANLLESYDKRALLPGLKDENKRLREEARTIVEKLVMLFGLGVLPKEAAS